MAVRAAGGGGSVKGELVKILEPYGLAHRDMVRLSKALAAFIVELVDEAMDQGERHGRNSAMADLVEARTLDSIEALDDSYERKAREA